MPHKPHHQRQHASLSLSIPGLLEVSGWFPELDADAQARVLDEMREQPVAAGAALCRRGETPLHWYGTLEGLLKWSITSDDGRSVTFGGLSVRQLVRRGHVAARGAALGRHHRAARQPGGGAADRDLRVAAPHAAELQPLPAGADQRAAALVHGQLRGPAPAGRGQPGGAGDRGAVPPVAASARAGRTWRPRRRRSPTCPGCRGSAAMRR